MLWLVRATVSLAAYYFALSYCIEGLAAYRGLKPEIAGASAFLAVVNPLTLIAIVTMCLLAVRVSVGELAIVALLVGCLQPLCLLWLGLS